MTKRARSIGVVLVALALAALTGSNGVGDPGEHDKRDYATIGSAPQALTEAELQKMKAAVRTPTPDAATSYGAGLLPPKPASFTTVGPASAANDAPDVAKQKRASQVEITNLPAAPAATKPPERSTSEAAAAGPTATEIGKLEALRGKDAMRHAPGRSER